MSIFMNTNEFTIYEHTYIIKVKSTNGIISVRLIDKTLKEQTFEFNTNTNKICPFCNFKHTCKLVACLDFELELKKLYNATSSYSPFLIYRMIFNDKWTGDKFDGDDLENGRKNYGKYYNKYKLFNVEIHLDNIKSIITYNVSVSNKIKSINSILGYVSPFINSERDEASKKVITYGDHKQMVKDYNFNLENTFRQVCTFLFKDCKTVVLSYLMVEFINNSKKSADAIYFEQ